MPPLNAAPQIQVKCVNVGCTEVDTPKQSPAGCYQEWDIPYDSTGERPGSWSWPVRV